MKKSVFMLIAVLVSLVISIPAYAGTWHQDGIGWWYERDDGSYPVDTWEWIATGNGESSSCYYFGSDGYLYVNTITPDGHKVNEDGACVPGGPADEYKEWGVDPATLVYTVEEVSNEITGVDIEKLNTIIRSIMSANDYMAEAVKTMNSADFNDTHKLWDTALLAQQYTNKALPLYRGAAQMCEQLGLLNFKREIDYTLYYVPSGKLPGADSALEALYQIRDYIDALKESVEHSMVMNQYIEQILDIQDFAFDVLTGTVLN